MRTGERRGRSGGLQAVPSRPGMTRDTGALARSLCRSRIDRAPPDGCWGLSYVCYHLTNPSPNQTDRRPPCGETRQVVDFLVHRAMSPEPEGAPPHTPAAAERHVPVERRARDRGEARISVRGSANAHGESRRGEQCACTHGTFLPVRDTGFRTEGGAGVQHRGSVRTHAQSDNMHWLNGLQCESNTGPLRRLADRATRALGSRRVCWRSLSREAVG
jgi:hypothetical protein